MMKVDPLVRGRFARRGARLLRSPERMIGEFEAEASDSFASLRQASLDFVFVSLTFRQPFVVFR